MSHNWRHNLKCEQNQTQELAAVLAAVTELDVRVEYQG